MPLLNILTSGAHGNSACLEIINATSPLEVGGKRDARYISSLFVHILIVLKRFKKAVLITVHLMETPMYIKENYYLLTILGLFARTVLKILYCCVFTIVLTLRYLIVLSKFCGNIWSAW
jgi:hypothetical protein